MIKIQRAIISVYDKRGVVEFSHKLKEYGVEILSTGGTSQLLETNGINVTPIAQVIDFPEILDGRVKTLHPRIHGGILARRNNPSHTQELAAHGIQPIDIVVVNLYPFREVVKQADADLETALDNIDIGGPSMLRAAAKNFPDVVIVTCPEDYPGVIKEMEANAGAVSWETRAYLAQKAFAHTAKYDSFISHYLAHYLPQDRLPDLSQDLLLHYDKVQELRYGENPHQKGYWYRQAFSPDGSLAQARQIQGKELSFNNILDADAALRVLADFTEITAGIIKHNNPCGVAYGASPLEAYKLALECDPASAFGGIVGFNSPLDTATAQELITNFLEIIIAPGYTPEALAILKRKTNLRVLEVPVAKKHVKDWDLKKISGGILLQEEDALVWDEKGLKVVTQRHPTSEEMEALYLAWRVAKQVKSNAIVFANKHQTVGIGAGQMSRVDAVKLAIMKARLPLSGTVVASDGFFPFRDSIDLAAQAGAGAIIQPGGSVRDAEVIEAANQHHMAMVFTGCRHFRH
ncbi:MAG: bifunctional phosphoribosylaminoimidazolecarboxamide formyltransferase/IMP cyclohydrolase [Nitrospinae bacterium RIFCSPLOWO2_12_FULL_45_22]|nr:MAG: bifunctional phosphoribosylaminoimidazolecarboxamide formyltransferase/IMP cyclohydrolase [Nitrospinae bacterium RIFCSPLOWO2_12_FULL_45_22]